MIGSDMPQYGLFQIQTQPRKKNNEHIFQSDKLKRVSTVTCLHFELVPLAKALFIGFVKALQRVSAFPSHDLNVMFMGMASKINGIPVRTLNKKLAPNVHSILAGKNVLFPRSVHFTECRNQIMMINNVKVF